MSGAGDNPTIAVYPVVSNESSRLGSPQVFPARPWSHATGFADIIAGSASSILLAAPSKPARKPKAPTLKEKEWLPHKRTLEELHVKQKKPLVDIISYMKTKFSFEAT